MDRRGVPRTGIALLRAAKLITPAGEFVCLLRDVARDGVRLRFFHAVPADTHVLLERGSGETHALLRVWQEGGNAGYRFTAPIDPAEFVGQSAAEAKAELMLRACAEATVTARGATHSATLLALGQRGAEIRCSQFLALGQPLTLGSAALGTATGWVRWRNGDLYGLIFERMSRLDELAAQVLALHAPTVALANPAIA